MKRNRTTALLSMLLAGLFALSWAQTTFGEEYPLPPGEGQMTGSQNDTGEGDKDRDRTGECKELLEVFGFAEEEYPLPPGEGQMIGSQNDTGQGDKDRDRTGECK